MKPLKSNRFEHTTRFAQSVHLPYSHVSPLLTNEQGERSSQTQSVPIILSSLQQVDEEDEACALSGGSRSKVTAHLISLADTCPVDRKASVPMTLYHELGVKQQIE